MVDFPTLAKKPSSFQFGYQANSSEFVSSLSSSVQTIELPAPRWTFTVSYLDLKSSVDDANALQAFLVDLRGRPGRFLLSNLAKPTPRGVATGTPLVKGAGQTGSTIITDGWTPSVTGILRKGDYIGFGGELKMVLDDANSDASGNATIRFGFPIRVSPQDNGVITTVSPTARFMLTGDTHAWMTKAPFWNDFNIQGIEVF